MEKKIAEVAVSRNPMNLSCSEETTGVWNRAVCFSTGAGQSFVLLWVQYVTGHLGGLKDKKKNGLGTDM